MSFNIKLKNDKSFQCDSSNTIFEAAKKSKILLEHSCLTARCRSCIVKLVEGKSVEKNEDLILSEEEKKNGFILSCNSIPISDLELDVEDIGFREIYEKKIYPAKVVSIQKISEDVISVILRLPPNNSFKFHSGQYINLIKGNIKRSYSIANPFKINSNIELLIKKYKNGQMSEYWFNKAKKDDLVRIEGPLGTFFLRETTKKNIIFLATGTGIAPIKSILENLNQNLNELINKKIWLFYGVQYEKDLLWEPPSSIIPNLSYVPVFSRQKNLLNGYKGYVQNAMIDSEIDLFDSQIYACGSINMINSTQLILNKIDKNNEIGFFHDAFVPTN